MFTSLIRSLRNPSISSLRFLPKIPHCPIISSLAFSQQKPAIYNLQFSSFASIKKRIEAQTEEEFDELQNNIRLNGEKHQSVIDSYCKLGNVYDLDSKYDDALGFYYQALKISLDLHGEDNINVGNCYHSIGQSYFYSGKNALALENFQKALDVYAKTLTSDDIRVGTCYANIGYAYFGEEKYEEGLKFCERALKIYEKTYDEDEPDLLNIYEELGFAYHELKRYEEEIYCHKKIVEIKTNIFGTKHIDLADSYLSLGNAFRHKGDSTSALDCFGQALSIYRTKGSGNKREIIQCLHNIGLTQIGQNKLQEALENFKKALDLIKKAYNNPTQTLSENHKFTGQALSLQGKNSEALDQFEEAFKVQSILSHYQKGTDLIELYTLTAKQHEKLNNTTQAIERYVKAAEAFRESKGEFHQTLADQYSHISKLLQKIGNAQEASEYESKAQNILEHLTPQKPATTQKTKKGAQGAEKTHRKEGGHGDLLSELKKEADRLSKSKNKEDLVKVAKLYDEIGNMYYNQEKFKEARENFERAQKHWKKLYGDNSIEIAGSYNNMAGALLGEGKGDNALKIAEKALGAIKKVLGDENVQIAGTYMNLGRILVHMENYERGLDYFRKAYEMRKKVLGEEAEATKVAEESYLQLKRALDEGELD